MNQLDRRLWLKSASLGLAGLSCSGWLPQIARGVAADPRRRRSCIVLWMGGGPSQLDTFDMKPGHENGGEFKEIATNVPGIRFSEHLPRLAKQADKLAIVRSLSTKEGDHQRGTYLMHTGQRPMGPVAYPAFGAALGKELAHDGDALPPYVCIAPTQAFGQDPFSPGFLGPKYSPLFVRGTDAPAGGNGGRQNNNDDDSNDPPAFAKLEVNSIEPPAGVTPEQMNRRLDLWRNLEQGFLESHAAAATGAHQTVYENALRMISSEASTAFDLSQEPQKVREAYGRGLFGQGCLMARRLVERGVPFIEVSLTASGGNALGWDTHADNFKAVAELSADLDAGWAALLEDLQLRGLLESTTILWIGEFGRTPQINGAGGRDHFPKAWSCVLAGGGVAGGQVYGKTSDNGMEVVENPVGVAEILATVCTSLGVPPETENMSESGRPIKIIDALPIDQLLA